MLRTAIYAAGVLVLVVGVVGLRSCDSPASDQASHALTTTAPLDETESGPRVTRHGVPVGWSHDDAGAVAAAVSAVRLTGRIAEAGFITRDDMIAELATETYGPILAAESTAQLGAMADELAAAGVTMQSVALHEIPLTARLVTADADRATVEVWAVTVIVVPDVAAPRQVWRTVTVDVLWERGDWRVDGWATAEGPTPALAVAAPIATSAEMVDVTSWPLAGGG